MRHPLRHLLAVSLGLLLSSPSLAAGDSYDDAFERARELERQGELEAAAAALESVLGDYPQDYAIALEVGWLHLRAGNLAGAERAYRTAVMRSPAASDARLGLIWTLVRRGECAEAATHLLLYEMTRPQDAGARKAIEACKAPAPAPPPAPPAPPAPAPAPVALWEPPRLAVSASLAVSKLWFPSHPIKSGGSGAAVGAGATVNGSWLVGGLYRYTSLATVDGVGVDPFSQRELYAYGGYAVAMAGVTAHVASITDGSGTFGTSYHAGVMGRLRLSLGEGYLGVSGSFYDDRKVLRAEPSWQIPVSKRMSLIPSIAAQNAGGEWLASGRLTMLLEGEAGRLWLGAKYGTEVRPAYLTQSVVYNVTERISWGLWAGARLNLSERLGLTASYSLDRLTRTDNLTPDKSFLHSFALGLSADF